MRTVCAVAKPVNLNGPTGLAFVSSIASNRTDVDCLLLRLLFCVDCRSEVCPSSNAQMKSTTESDNRFPSALRLPLALSSLAVGCTSRYALTSLCILISFNVNFLPTQCGKVVSCHKFFDTSAGNDNRQFECQPNVITTSNIDWAGHVVTTFFVHIVVTKSYVSWTSRTCQSE